MHSCNILVNNMHFSSLPTSQKLSSGVYNLRKQMFKLMGEGCSKQQSSSESEDDPFSSQPKQKITPEIIVTSACSLESLPSQDCNEEDTSKLEKPSFWLDVCRVCFFLVIWCLIVSILLTNSEHETKMYQISVPKERVKSFWIDSTPAMKRMTLEIRGAVLPSPGEDLYLVTNSANNSHNVLEIWVELVQVSKSNRNVSTDRLLTQKHLTYYQKISDVWTLRVFPDKLLGQIPGVKRTNAFIFHKFGKELVGESRMRLRFHTNMERSMPLTLSYDLSAIDPKDGVIYAALILLGLYIIIIFEIVHQMKAAVIAALTSVAVLAAFDERPTTEELIKWMDHETLLLLFSMMVLVAIFSETGIFDYLAVLAYKITKGRVWPLIDTLCIFTAVVSCFLDNVTTALLMTPVTIRLCEVMELNPVPVLIAMIMFSNIGGAVSPVGDPPNVIIATNQNIIDAGVSFFVFILHMGVGVIMVMVIARFQLRYMYRNIKDLRHNEPKVVQGLRHEIEIWQRTAGSISSYTKDEEDVKETLLKRVRRLLTTLKKRIVLGNSTMDQSMDKYAANLEELEEKYPIRDKVLLWKCIVSLTFVLMVFFLRSVLDLKVSIGFTALLGVLLLLILSYRQDLEAILSRLELSTLIFFTALFILMEALSRLGLIDWIGRQTEGIIYAVNEEYRLTVAIVLVLWVSALASSFLDNIPLTTMMVRIVTSLSKNPILNLPLQPLVWSLALGACLGGNGTLFGASANMICAGVAEQHGYHFSFIQFFKIGFPIMVVSVAVVTGYLLVAHVAIGWH